MNSRNSKTRPVLGKRIQKFRKVAGYSQDKLADMVKISRTHMGHIEQGRKSPSLEVLDKIARALKVNASELLSF